MSFRLIRKKENILFPAKLAYNHQLSAFEIRFVNMDASDVSNLHIRAFVRRRTSRAQEELIRDLMFPVKLSMTFEPYVESMMVVALRTVPPGKSGCELSTEFANAISLDTFDELSSFIIVISATAVDSGDSAVARKIYRYTDIVVGNYRDIERDLPPDCYGNAGNWRHRRYDHFNTIDGPNIPANEWRQKNGREGRASIEIEGGNRTLRFPATGNAATHIKNILAGSVYRLPMFGETPMQITPTTIIDVGANIGASATLFLSRYPKAKVVCFEPHTGNFQYLKRNLADLPNLELLPVGLFDKDVEETLFDGATQCLQPSIFQSAEVKMTGEPIKLKDALKELEHRIDSNTLLKIDTEGCECFILKRIEPLLKDIKLIYVEFHSEASRMEIEQLLIKTHGLWNCNISYAHRGELCYLHRDVWAKVPDICKWIITR